MPPSEAKRRAGRPTAVRIGVIAGLVASTSSITTLSTMPTVNAASLPAPAHTPKWTRCDAQETPGAECASLPLPIDWGHPNGPKFELSVARRKATDPGDRVGSLVFGPGGPGDSGVDRVVEGISRFSPEVRRRFDIISFDPRGVGRSNPITCSDDLTARRPSPKVETEAAFRATLAYNTKLRADCRERTGPLFDHLDTLSTVHDLEAVRVALGEPKLTFHGSSYGTMLGAQYAETYPHRIRAMVLESVLDHSVPTARVLLRDQGLAAQDSFNEFVKWCTANTGCALHGRDVRAVWKDLLDRAERGELENPSKPGARLSSIDLVNTIAFRAFYKADFAGLAQTILALEKSRPLPAGSAVLSPLPPSAPIFCSDFRLPVRDHREYASLVRTLNRTAPDMPYLLPLRMVASCMGAPTNNPQHRLKVNGAPTILLSNALHDPATGYSWARSVTRQLGRSGVLLTYDGHGHGSVTNGPCMENTVNAYLTDLKAPAQGATCPAPTRGTTHRLGPLEGLWQSSPSSRSPGS
ncbi:alpha/beta fold hydrolase [Actinomadura graeca]|uniref:Alpha/beta fold hydrolase n=1 Tax=Actinomadura graeca TaxID=2750812 RepID=A0ABX8QWS7_9ACTN|nr:alpha/beta hydrolase [Actinomadura graeca]QXJ22781.1 alpha/beta fold hydrolase [Actinomadura graeca]